MEQSGTARELPRYRSHKEVWALKIKAIEYDSDNALLENRETDGSAMITPAEAGYAPFRVSREYVRKRLPVNGPIVGGYWVRYLDGYESFSPAAAFEEGYTKIGDHQSGAALSYAMNNEDFKELMEFLRFGRGIVSEEIRLTITDNVNRFDLGTAVARIERWEPPKPRTIMVDGREVPYKP